MKNYLYKESSGKIVLNTVPLVPHMVYKRKDKRYYKYL